MHILVHSLFSFCNRYNAEKGSNWIVNRTLHTHGANKWTLNGKQTTEAAVISLHRLFSHIDFHHRSRN